MRLARSARAVSLLATALCAAGCSAPEESAPGVGEPIESRASDGAAASARSRRDLGEIERWRSQRARASFEPESISRVDAAIAARLSPDGLLAWSEARVAGRLSPAPDVERAIAARTAPEEQRALLLGYVQSGTAADEEELVAALESADPQLREAAILVCARSNARQLPLRVLGREVLSADELELLDVASSGAEPRWNRISGAWAEERFRAALRHGRVDGRSGRAVAEDELRADPAFLREVALAALRPEGRAALAPHVGAACARGVSADLLARLLAENEPAVFFPDRGPLEPARAALVRDALLSPACSEGTVEAVIALRERLPTEAPWRSAARLIGGEPAAGLSLRRGFEALRREDALAALVILGRTGRAEALALLSELAHPARDVSAHIFAARVACGDLQPLELVFARAFEAGGSERRGALEALLATGAAQRQRAWITAHSQGFAAEDVARLAWSWGARDLMTLFPLLAEEVSPAWGALAVERLLADASEVPAELASGWPRGAAWSYDRALGAALARARKPRGLGLLEEGLRRLDTDGALLAAAALLDRLGRERGSELLRAGLLTASTADEQARWGWISGRLLGNEVWTWLAESGGGDPARDAAWLGAAAAAAAEAAAAKR
ncbi:MAG: hypothetical protein JNM84_21940 [Planctomycetes bacterium]|nr:hypothetical protein [Planctomycetota bacterium]